FDPAGIVAAVPTRESIADARAYHDLAKLDLAAMGADLTRPFIAAAGGQGERVRLLDRVANGGKRMPDHGLRCERGDDQNQRQFLHVSPAFLSKAIVAEKSRRRCEGGHKMVDCNGGSQAYRYHGRRLGWRAAGASLDRARQRCDRGTAQPRRSETR